MIRQTRSTPGFLIAAAVVAHTLWTSAAPAMVYPFYARQWHLTPAVTTGIFAIYPLTVVATLVAFGNLSDQIGTRRAMLLGVGASAAGVLLFALATDVAVLFAGRVLMGLGVGLSAGPSVAALVEQAGPGAGRKASAATLVAQAVGLTAAFLLGGALAQYSRYPTRLSFFVLFALLVALFVAVLALPRQPAAMDMRWRPRLPQIPRELRQPFWFASLTVMAGYTHGVLIPALGAQIGRDLVRSENIFVNGGVLSLFAIALGITGLFSRGIDASEALSTAMAGTGYALLVYGGLTLLNARTPERSRGSVTSATFLLAYLFSGILALGLGRVATNAGMEAAVLVSVIAMLVLCTIVAVVARALSEKTDANAPRERHLRQVS